MGAKGVVPTSGEPFRRPRGVGSGAPAPGRIGGVRAETVGLWKRKGGRSSVQAFMNPIAWCEVRLREASAFQASSSERMSPSTPRGP